ncbi:uncharacterized protein H6S33_003212 [Morchella sextelata]|uniref:uncharacterized protein n=1 Tax=Morchella sextelata TaxID=1174677 RepID=UPI001D04A6B3|nr:uncharacterized protein H6S33_003212 [Morchella sextelata]KAH0607224.1 hypothetical protein H6S33_003212 [Morchella sextelata]
MCLNIFTHHGCFHPVFISKKTTMDCSDTVHPGVIHEYSESPCAVCLAPITDDDRSQQIYLAEQAVRKLFYTRCIDQSDHKFLDYILDYYKFHSFPGHECKAPYHCYEQCPEKYYTYCTRTQHDIAVMPPSLRLQLYGSGTYLDHAANTMHIREGKCAEGIFNADLYPYAHLPLVSKARNRPEFYQNLAAVDEEEGSPYEIWDMACRAGSSVPEIIQNVKDTVKDNGIVAKVFRRLSGFFGVVDTDENEEA